MMSVLRLLSCTLLYVSLVNAERDPKCVGTCTCCKDVDCRPDVWSLTKMCTHGCIDGHTGVRCHRLCRYPNCKSCKRMKCDTCFDGYHPGRKSNCNSHCPSSCKSCTSKSNCTECKEGFYDKDGSTTCQYRCPKNCNCNSTSSCTSCKNGFYDISVMCERSCPLNCERCMSNETCEKCSTGFYNGYKYDNISSVQMNNCTYTCREECTECQSYNQCSRCVDGKHGWTCQEDCSIGCKDNKCLIGSGNCDCLYHFWDEKCTECIQGKYGKLCNLTCPKYCETQYCDKTTGDCIGGCFTEAITGKTCNECRVGMYGELCDKMCPEMCKNSRCERYTGSCELVCLDGCAGITIVSSGKIPAVGEGLVLLSVIAGYIVGLISSDDGIVQV